MMPRSGLGLTTAVLHLLLLAACEHVSPFHGNPSRATTPFQTSTPVRLTYNIGADTHAAWSADGSLVYYSAQDSFTVDKDRCIATLAVAGGTRHHLVCPAFPANDITEILDQPAPLGGQIAYTSSALGINEHSAFRHAIWVAEARWGATPKLVRDFPYLAPSGKLHDAPLYLQWLRPGVLVYLGAQNGCCRKDTLRFGEQAVWLDVSINPPVTTFIPGTELASSVSASEDGTAIDYTFYGDSRVYHQVLATGTVTVLHDFGPGRIARDVQVVGDRLVATVDGLPRYWERPPLGFVQVDYGGLVTLVDLTTGTETQLPDRGLLYKRPRLSHDGRRLVVEGYPFRLSGTSPVDTVVSKWADLWLVEE